MKGGIELIVDGDGQLRFEGPIPIAARLAVSSADGMVVFGDRDFVLAAPLGAGRYRVTAISEVRRERFWRGRTRVRRRLGEAAT